MIKSTLICVVLTGLSLFTRAQEEIPLNLAIDKVAKTIMLVEKFYVDSTNAGNIAEIGIRSILKELDPHSVYISKEKLKETNEPLVGSFDGIGIQFSIQDDTIQVVTPIPGGPSEKLGIQSGDKIIKIEDELVAGVGYTNNDVFKSLKGPKGTKVKVSILRYHIDELIDFTITRDKIPVHSLDAGYQITPELGYIKLNRFSGTTMNEFRAAFSAMRDDGMKHLILDLRNNGGGYLKTAIELADEFLEENKMIVYTDGMYMPRQTHFSTSEGDFDGRLIVLINEGSASASEIVAGAIQDWDRGVIIGRRSFGKGLVQKPYGLPDGSAIRLTTARYYTPTGRCIQKPYDKGTDEYHHDLITRMENGELINKDSISFPDSLKYYTPRQRVVYGGGGIMPDIFVAIDTNSFSKYYQDALKEGLTHEFAMNYVNEHRARLKSTYSKFKDFEKGFAQEDIMKEFYKYAGKKGIDNDGKDDERSVSRIENHLKALCARNLWSYAKYYEILNQEDIGFKKAVELILDESKYNEKVAQK